MGRDQMITTADFVHASVGPHSDTEDNGSAFITTPHATLEVSLAFEPESVSRLTLIP